VKECERRADQSTRDPCVRKPGSNLCGALKFILDEIVNNSGSKEVRDIGRMMGPEGCDPAAIALKVCGSLQSQSAALINWYKLVCTNCAWDHKPTIKGMWGSPYAADPATGNAISHDIFSNVHYGYVGREAGIAPDTLQLVNSEAADRAPKQLGLGKYERSDFISTQVGIDLQRNYRPNQLSTGIIYNAIMARSAEYVATGDGKIKTR
jgi:hypothetical protein